jgi:hypothetical protein
MTMLMWGIARRIFQCLEKSARQGLGECYAWAPALRYAAIPIIRSGRDRRSKIIAAVQISPVFLLAYARHVSGL